MNLIKYLTFGLLASAGSVIAQKSDAHKNNFHPCNKISYDAARKGAGIKPRMPVYNTAEEANSCHPFNKAKVYINENKNYKQRTVYKVNHSLGQFNPNRKDCAIESVQAGLSNEFSSLEKFKQCPPSNNKGESFYIRTAKGRKKVTINSVSF